MYRAIGAVAAVLAAGAGAQAMTASEQAMRCWIPPASSGGFVVELAVDLDEEGRVLDTSVLDDYDERRGPDRETVRSFAKAVVMCSPYRVAPLRAGRRIFRAAWPPHDDGADAADPFKGR